MFAFSSPTPPSPRIPKKLRLVWDAAMLFYMGMTSPAAPPDEMSALLLSVGRDRDKTAFAALFDHFAPRVKSYLRRLGTDPTAADELAQEVMLSIWRKAETFDPARAAAATWVFTIARNKRLDSLRREPRPDYDPADPALVVDPADPADERIADAQAASRLRSALKDLPVEQSDLLKLAYFQDMPHSLIATERGIPLGTVKSRLRLAMERLRKALRDER